MRVVTLLAVFLALEAQAVETERWRYTHALPAPWGEPLPGSAALAGQVLEFGTGALAGPHPIACEPARVEAITMPAEGLFEGGLAPDAEPKARGLGIGRFPVPVTRVTCPNAGFDFAHADAETLLVALDNRIWTLSRAAGALAPADAPEGVVQALLEVHYAHDMGFRPEGLKVRERWLAPALREAIGAYFAQAWPEDEPPPINGDPYTDSQEYPTRFAVCAATVDGDRAEVPVRFADGWVEYTLRYQLVREAGAGWRVDDIRSRDGSTWRAALAARP